MSDQIFWYVSRSAGLISWGAAAGSILAGTMIPSRLLGRKPTIPWLTDLHRMLAALASVFLLVHMGALWFDEFVQFRLGELLIPFRASVPGVSRTSLALGVIAAWLLAAVELSSLIRDRLPTQFWRSIHLMSYAILLSGTVHALMAGSDVTNPVIAASGTSLIVAVVLASVVRLRRRQPPPGSSQADKNQQGAGQSPAPEPHYATGQHPVVEQAYSTGQHPAIDQSYSTGQHPAIDQSYSTGQHPVVEQAYSTGHYPVVDQSYSTGQHPITEDHYSTGQHPITEDHYSTGQHPIAEEYYATGQHPVVDPGPDERRPKPPPPEGRRRRPMR